MLYACTTIHAPTSSSHQPKLSQGGTTTQGEPQPRHPRTQRPSPSQRAVHTPPLGSSERRHLLIPKAPAIPSPTQAMEGPQTMLGRPRPTTPLPIQRPSSSGAFTPAHCAPVFPVGQPTPGLARPSCPCLSRRPCHPSTRRMHRDAGSERPPQAASSTSAVRSCAAHELGSAPHNPDHSRQHVGIIQPGADGSAQTPGLVSSHGPSIACPSTKANRNPRTTTKYRPSPHV